MPSWQKITLGALGGLSAVLAKFLGQDYPTVVAHAANFTADELIEIKIGYGLLTPILVFLGAFIAWLSDERRRMKIVALAVAAPALITTWSGGQGKSSPPVLSSVPPSIISSAYAQSPETAKHGLPPAHPDELANKSTWERIENGVAAFFGYGKQPRHYTVVVGSFIDQRAALDFAEQVNQEAPSLKAHVGARLQDAGYYPVIVGNPLPLGDARELKARALATQTIKDAYLSVGGEH